MQHDTVINRTEGDEKQKCVAVKAIVRFLAPLSLMLVGIYVEWRIVSLIRNPSSIEAELISTPVPRPIIVRRNRREELSHIEYSVDYRFTVDQKNYSGHDTLKKRPRSDRITVYYETGDPANNRACIPHVYAGLVWIWLSMLLLIFMNRQMWEHPR